MKSRLLRLINTLKLVTPFTLALATGIGSNTSAHAIQFTFTHNSDTPDYVINGFEEAGNFWSSKLQDEVKINIRVHFQQPSNSNALGASLPNMVRVNYDNFLNNSFRDISSEDDLTAFKNLQIDSGNQGFTNILQTLGVDLEDRESANRKLLRNAGFDVQANRTIIEQAQDIFQQITLEQLNTLDRNQIQFFDSRFSMVMNDEQNISYKNYEQLKSLDNNILVDDNGSFNNNKIWLSRANAKALNLLSDNDNTEFDAQIYINNNSIWDFSRINNRDAEIDSNKFDLLTVAEHEIGHALGFVSGVDVLKLLYNDLSNTITPENDRNQRNQKGKKNQNNQHNQTNDQILLEDELAYVSPMDLFRCSDNSKNQGIFDWSVGSQTYFSIDGCQTDLGEFADGDRYQVSHWSEDRESPLGIMNPTLSLGNSLNISDLDLKLLNVIGWDIKSTSNDSAVNPQIDNTTSITVDDSAESSTSDFTAIDKNQSGKKNHKNTFKKIAPDNNIQRRSQDSYSHNSWYGFWQEADYTQATDVPEPSMIAGLGVVGLFGWVRRRRTR